VCALYIDLFYFFLQAEDGKRDLVGSRGSEKGYRGKVKNGVYTHWLPLLSGIASSPIVQQVIGPMELEE
ncbi:hypothetical protein, partial [Vibrio parahaemolyticus]|uniref:hypothetical protein n=1 Tax=Vibrio parahaemolyticus TaxID=670 RepID=UPI001D1355B1